MTRDDVIHKKDDTSRNDDVSTSPKEKICIQEVQTTKSTIMQQSNKQMVEIVSRCQQQANGSTENQDKNILKSAATKNKKTGLTTPKKGNKKKRTNQTSAI
jgi:hypothetical protein